MIRRYTEADREPIQAITAICFAGVSIDYAIELRHGVIAGKDWRWRKAQQIADDIAANAEGIFVAIEDGKVVGYVTSRVDCDTKIGWIPNLAVLPAYQQRGLGQALIETALTYLAEAGMLYARIETLAHNAVGQHFYPSMGFVEVARQIHYIKPLGSGE
ncbi:MAG TPA: GNAT family N-acetyltransferase [Anaerolineae bacterium]|nr:GNAT family N-acetyltransferase [Anaerolineae bacterium]HQI84806.1 GNAT family N-acetyltransferase [Anaerolineae bacterium]